MSQGSARPAQQPDAEAAADDAAQAEPADELEQCLTEVYDDKELEKQWALNAQELKLPNGGYVSFTELLLNDRFDLTEPCWQPGWVAPHSNVPCAPEVGANGDDVEEVAGLASSYMSGIGYS